MKASYIFLAFIAILMYNGLLIQRDKQLFEAYDKACASLPQPHPNCIYAKWHLIPTTSLVMLPPSLVLLVWFPRLLSSSLLSVVIIILLFVAKWRMNTLSVTLSKHLQSEFISYLDVCNSLHIQPNINSFLNYQVNYAHLADTVDYTPHQS